MSLMRWGAVVLAGLGLIAAGCGASSEASVKSVSSTNGAATSAATTSTAVPSTTTTAEPAPTTTVAPTTTTSSAFDSLKTTETFILSSSSGSFYYGAVVANTGTSPIINARIDVEAYDDAGHLVDSSPDYAQAIFPGVPYVVKAITQAGQPTRVDVKANNDVKWSTVSNYGGMTVENVQFAGQHGFGKVTGEVHSTFAQDQQGIEVTAIWKDASGIVGVEETYVDKLYAGQVSDFDIGVFTPATQRAPDEIVANL
jgi:hypothetical protein